MALRILVTDGEQRAALAVTRSLGARGHAVWVSAATRRSLAGLSRYCAGEYAQAGGDAGPEAAVDSLLGLIRELQPDAVVGVTDRTITALHHAARGSALPALPPPEADDYFKASDKVRLVHCCRQRGIAVPETLVSPGGAVPSAAALAPLGSPLVVRPALSWRAAGGRWIPGRVSLEADREALAARVATDPALATPYLVQQRIEGDGCGLFVLALDGRLAAVFSHRRLREKPPWGGVSTLCESVAPPSDLIDAVSRYVAGERWSGLAMFEFKRSRRDGAARLLEINARPWGSLGLAQACGVDFAAAWIGACRGMPPRPSPAYRCGIRLRWWWGDVDHFYLRRRAEGRPARSAIVRALVDAARSGPWAEAWDTLRLDDPLPFGAETLAWLRG